MAFATPSVDNVREELGSPSTDDLSDETIQRLIDEEGTLFGAAFRGAEILARKYAFKADLAVGDYREDFSAIAKRWQELAAELRRKVALYGAKPYAGGISKSDKKRIESDTDRPEPDFRRGMWDNNYT